MNLVEDDISNPSQELDHLDYRILEYLQQDCSITNQTLAKQVQASPPTTLRRVRRLAAAGYIEGQVALLSAAKLGWPLTAIIEITLDSQAAEIMQAFESRMVDEDVVTQCYRVAPGPDFILIVQVADMAAYHALAHRAFTSAARVRNVRSFFSTHQAKFTTQLPLKRRPRQSDNSSSTVR
jgi:Lrp/AsnC family leucine-responsive transcriptional regulator